MRNEEIEIPKPEGRFRISVIGDSHVFGGMVFENTIPKQIEIFLNNDLELKKISGKKFEVVNAGIPTFNLRSIYFFYHYKVRQLQSDILFYLFHTNDFEETIYYPSQDSSGKTFFIAYPSLKYSGDLLNLLPYNIETFLARNSYFYRYLLFVIESLKIKEKSSYNIVHPSQLKYLDMMAAEAGEDNSLFVVSVLGTLKSMSSCNPDDFIREVTEIFISHSRKLGLYVIDISDVLCGMQIDKLDRGDHGHFSDFANNLLSRRIYEQMRRLIMEKFP
ncbi:MAG: hypothetical protein ACP5QK_09110 [Myxococcota bacterium]